MSDVYFKAKNDDPKKKTKQQKKNDNKMGKLLKKIDAYKSRVQLPPIVDPIELERQYALKKYVRLPESTRSAGEKERERRELKNYMKTIPEESLPSGISGIHRYVLEKKKEKEKNAEKEEAAKFDRERIRGAIERLDLTVPDILDALNLGLPLLAQPTRTATASATSSRPLSATSSQSNSRAGSPQPIGTGFNFDDMHPALAGGLLGHDIIHNNPQLHNLRNHANKVILGLADRYGKPLYKDLVTKLVNHGKTISTLHPAVTESFKNMLQKVQGGSFFDDVKNKIADFVFKYNPLSLMVKHSINKGLEARNNR